MGKEHQPGFLLCTFIGAMIGAVASVLIPAANLPNAVKITLPSLSLDAPDAAPNDGTVAADFGWSNDLGNTLRAAMGLARRVTLRDGDTLRDVLVKTGIDRVTAFNVVEAVNAVYNPKRFRAGQELDLSYEPADDDGAHALSQVDFEVDPGHSVSVTRDADGSFAAHEIVASTHREYVRAEGTIDTSLFKSAHDVGVPQDVLTEMVKLFSYDVDFQRDLQKGDQFALMYERAVTDDGRPVRNFTIAFATMVLSGTPFKFYAFPQDDGSVEYYNEKGEGIRKALLRTPVNGAVLTSGFGVRLHPILGYSLMHRGVDFGVPEGTPIMAAGDGVIEKRELAGSYGNYIRIKHNAEYSTAYGHMSRFATGLSVGSRIHQGQIIGYVGHTGLATGPHLHFEVLKNMVQVNPINVKFPASEKLAGAMLTRFRATEDAIDQTFANLGTSEKFANAKTPSQFAH